MRIALFPAANDGCRRYRMDLPANVLKQQGYDIDVRMDYAFRTFETRDTHGNESIAKIKGTIPWDVVVFQRPLRRRIFELMGFLQDRGVTCITELDDSFHDLAISHPTFAETHPDTDPDKNRDWLMRCTMQADWVTVTTPYLAQRYAPHGRVSVLPNYVPRDYLDIQRQQSDDLRIGWSGSTHTHVGDLRQLGGVIQGVLDETGANVCIIGTGDRVQEQLELNSPPLCSGWAPLEKYADVLAQVDIGIAPHKITNFGKAKSRLKPLQMAALGVVPVMSPIPDYLDLHSYGIGLMASTPEEWREHLLHLAKDKDFRHSMAQEGREIVREHFLIENQAYRWPIAWEQAVTARENANFTLNAS